MRPVARPDGRLRVLDPSGRLEARFGGETPEVVELTARDADRPNRRLEHPGPVNSAFFTADGRTLFAVMKEHGVRRWDVTTGEASGPLLWPDGLETGELPEVGPGRKRIQASRDGTILILVDRTESLQVWDTTAGRRLLGPLQTSKELPVEFGPRDTAGTISNAAVSPDGRRVAGVSASSGTLAVWDVPTGRLLFAHSKRFRGRPFGLGFSADGRWVLVASGDTVTRIWDVETGRLAGPPLHHSTFVSGGDITPDGTRIVTATSFTLYLWDRATGDLLSRDPVQVQGAASSFDSAVPYFSADGRRLVLTDGTTAFLFDLPEFRAPETALAPLAELLTGQRLDDSGGAEYLDQGAILTDPARYRRAWLASRGLGDDPAAQRERLEGP